MSTKYITSSDNTYKTYVALLTQTGTDAPIPTILENTIGEIVWTYQGTGQYRATLSGTFSIGKTFFNITGNSAGDGWVLFSDISGLPDYFDLIQYDSTGLSVDNLQCFFEIKVYN